MRSFVQFLLSVCVEELTVVYDVLIPALPLCGLMSHAAFVKFSMGQCGQRVLRLLSSDY